MNIEAATTADAVEILALQKLAFLGEAELCGVFNIPPLTQTLDEIIDEFARLVFFEGGRWRKHNNTCLLTW